MRRPHGIAENINLRRIKHLIRKYPYGDYRRYRVFSKESQYRYLLDRAQSINNEPKSLEFHITEGKKAIGAALLRYLEWDTRMLGRKMWQIGYLTADGHYKKAVKTKIALLKKVLEAINNIRDTHLSCKIDTEDITSIHALESSGFRLMDTVATWLFRPPLKSKAFKPLFNIRDFTDKDLPILTRLAANSFSRNRLHIDPSIKHEKADRLYAEWVRNYCLASKDQATGTKVAERRGKIAGFLCYKLNRALEKITGYKIIGEGLMAVDPYCKGAGVALVNEIAEETVSNYDFAEFDGLITNYEAIRIYEAFGFKVARSRHTFHYFKR